MKKYIIPILVIATLLACNQYREPQVLEFTVPAKTENNDSTAFIEDYRKVQASRLTEDSTLSTIEMGTMYNDSVSPMHEYSLLFYYLMTQQDESYSEGVSFQLFNVLKRYETKRKSIKQYTLYLPKQESDTMQYLITSALSLDLLENGYNLAKYKRDFSPLTTESNLKAFNFLVTRQGNP